MFQRRLILEEYGMDVEYISGKKNIAADVLSRLPNKVNQETTHDSTYTTEKMLELYDIEELSEGTFPLLFKRIDCYQREDPILTGGDNYVKYKRVIFAETGIL